MSTSDSERFIFEAEWYDKVSSTLKKFYLHYFPSDNSVELFDLKMKKTFLRRSKCEGVEMKDFYVGATVTIFSRSMKITDFADRATKDKFSSKIIKTYIVLKPNAISTMGEIFKFISNHDFHISNIRMVKISHEDAKQIFKSIDEQSIIDCITCGPVVAVELLSKDGIAKWEELSTAFEKNAFSNCILVLENDVIDYFFPSEKSKKSKLKNTATLNNCTCCIIKPHAVQAGLTALIIDDIQKANFRITAIQRFYVDFANAEEFLEVYKGILPDYAAMVSELQSGPCIAMEVTHENKNSDVVTEFRKFCGPMDPEMAKQLRANTLRAKYGKTKVQNAIHCSDLSEDGLLEVEYFFKILDEN